MKNMGVKSWGVINHYGTFRQKEKRLDRKCFHEMCFSDMVIQTILQPVRVNFTFFNRIRKYFKPFFG